MLLRVGNQIQLTRTNTIWHAQIFPRSSAITFLASSSNSFTIHWFPLTAANTQPAQNEACKQDTIDFSFYHYLVKKIL